MAICATCGVDQTEGCIHLSKTPCVSRNETGTNESSTVFREKRIVEIEERQEELEPHQLRWIAWVEEKESKGVEFSDEILDKVAKLVNEKFREALVPPDEVNAKNLDGALLEVMKEKTNV